MSDLGVYIHVPFCKHACPYCDFYKIELRAIPAATRLAFIDVVQQEFLLHVTANPGLVERRLESIYFGGGTPSTLKPEQVGDFVAFLKSSFAGADSAAMSVWALRSTSTSGGRLA